MEMRGGREGGRVLRISKINYDILKIDEKLMNHLLQAKLYFRPI